MSNRLTQNYLPSERVVSFIDIIGFSAIINSITIDQEGCRYKYNLIERVLNEKSRRLERNRERFSEEAIQRDGLLRSSMEGALFSDSIVVSSPINEKPGLSETFIIEEIIDMASYLLSDGIFIRGGIASGWCYHDKNIVFGQGMINACNLEKNNANVPRILVTDDIVEVIKIHNDSYAEIILSRDTDGLWFVNIFNSLLEWINLEPDYFDAELLKNARKHIIDGLEQSKDSEYRIKSKYRWLSTQFNLSIDKYNRDNVLDRYGIFKIQF